MKVKDTNLINIQPFDVLMFKKKGLLNFDFLGELISWGEGNAGRDENGDGKPEPGRSSGDYTHCAWVRDIPDPEAEVEETRPGIFRVKDIITWTEKEELPSLYSDIKTYVDRLRSNAGVKVHATWPRVLEEPIPDWDNIHVELWRIRELDSFVKTGIRSIINDQIGYDYNLANFITFGFLNQAHANICSMFISDPVYNATLVLGKPPISLTPDLAGMRDCQKTPNDLINSGWMFRPTWQGIKNA